MIALLIALAAAAPAAPVEEVLWSQTPVPMVLAVDRERRLELPEPVQIGLPPRLADQLEVTSVEHVVLFRARTPFPRSRVLLQSLEDGRTWLLDLSAEAEAPAGLGPLRLIDPARLPPPEAAPERPRGDRRVLLTRYAARQLYAPARLRATLAGVASVPVPATEILGLYRGGGLAITPIAAWTADGLYVTALRIENTGLEVVELDPRALRGRWQTATFQRHRLAPLGDPRAVTALYLVSERRFEESLP